MNRNIAETIVGFIVIVVACMFVYVIYTTESVMNTNPEHTYKVIAQFDRADGINVGSDIKLSGIKIGIVKNMYINKSNFDAVVSMAILDEYKLPADSSAEIVSNGFLGEKYISIVPGSEERFLSNGDKIEFSQSSISIESLIGKYIFGGADSKKPAATK